MTRLRLLLVAVIAVELIGGGLLAFRRMSRPTPPLPDLSEVDPLTAGEFRRLAANCHTASDWTGLGETYLAAGFFPEGEGCLRRAVELEGDNCDVRLKHAFALDRLGLLEEANGQYEAAARNRARSADCYYYIGRNHLRLGQRDSAVEAFGRAGALPGARYERALLDARSGRLTEADQEAARLAAVHLDAYQPPSLRYRIALARQDAVSAADFADQFDRRPRPLATPFDSEVDWIFGLADGFGRARLFRDAGREVQAGGFSAAEEKLREALDARWEPEVADRLAEVVFILGRPEEAAAILTGAVDNGGPTFELLWRLGQAEGALGRHERAVALWERAAQSATGPGAKELWLDLAAQRQRDRKAEEARRLTCRAHLVAGLSLLDAGRANEALGALDEAVKADAHHAHAWFGLGEARRLLGKRDEARSAYNKCLELDIDHGRARRARSLLDRK